MMNIEDRIKRIREQLIKRKTGAETEGDSTLGYFQEIDLGGIPLNGAALFEVWLAPIYNIENFFYSASLSAVPAVYIERWAAGTWTQLRECYCRIHRNPIELNQFLVEVRDMRSSTQSGFERFLNTDRLYLYIWSNCECEVIQQRRIV